MDKDCLSFLSIVLKLVGLCKIENSLVCFVSLTNGYICFKILVNSKFDIPRL